MPLGERQANIEQWAVIFFLQPPQHKITKNN